MKRTGEKTTWLWQWIRHVGAPGGRDMGAGGRCGPGGLPTMITAPRQVKVTDSHLTGQEMQCRIEVRAHSGTDPQADSLLVRCGNSIGRSCTRQLGTDIGGSGSDYFDCGCRLLGAPAPYGKRPALSAFGVSFTLPLASSSGSLVFLHLSFSSPIRRTALRLAGRFD